MVLTDVKVLPIQGRNNCVGIAQFKLDNLIKFTGIKLYYDAEKNKKYLSYPINPGNKHREGYFFPIDKDLKEFIFQTVWQAYDNTLEWSEEQDHLADIDD